MSEQQLIESLNQIRQNFELKNNDLLSVNDLSSTEIEKIFELTKVVESFLKGKMKKVPLSKGKSQLNFFLENSTRTRVSFELAGKNQNIDTINITGDKSSMSKGETLLDTAISLDQMQPDLIVMRSPYSGSVNFFARNTQASVINAGDGTNEHPTQGLLDLYTMSKFKTQNFHPSELQNKKLLIIGDILHSRVFGSLARLSKLYNLQITVSAPHTLIRPNLSEWGIYHEPNLEKALENTDIIYVLRLQTERAAASFVPTIREYSKTYVINQRRLKLAKPDAVVLHPGPVIRETDIHTNVLETEASLVPEQVFSGYCLRFILLWLLSNKRHQKQKPTRIFKP